jgi:hypothetical protein
VAVFVIWAAPDMLWPHYRGFWLFTNSVLGSVNSSVPAEARSRFSFILFRSFGCVVLAPILEELFWRGWLTRWLIYGTDFRRVPLGAYTASLLLPFKLKAAISQVRFNNFLEWGDSGSPQAPGAKFDPARKRGIFSFQGTTRSFLRGPIIHRANLRSGR